MLLQQRVCGALPGGAGGNAFEAKRSGPRSVRSRTAWTVAQSDFAGGSFYDDDDGDAGSGDDKGRGDDMVSMKSGFGGCSICAALRVSPSPLPSRQTLHPPSPS